MTVALAVSSTSCHRVNEPVSTVNMADTTHANQLIAGFYGVEMHAWRWTAHRFSVGLKPPPGSAHNGAKLRAHLFIPDVQIQKLGPMTLCATAAGHRLEPETFLTSGTHVYWRDVPAEVLDTNIIPVTFEFDKWAPRVGLNGRELAAVVASIGLIPK